MRKKYIFVLSNQKKYGVTNLKDDEVLGESDLHWYALTPTLRTDVINMVVRQRFRLSDWFKRLNADSSQESMGF